MHCVSCTSNLSCGFTFGTIGNVVVTEFVLDLLRKKKPFIFKRKSNWFFKAPLLFHISSSCGSRHIEKLKSKGMFSPLPSLFSWRNAGDFRAIMPWSALHTPFPACYVQHQGSGGCRAGRKNYSLPCKLALQMFIPLEMPFFFQDRIGHRAKCQFPAACVISFYVPVVLEMKKPRCYTISV